MTFTATVQWLERTRRDYKLVRQTVCGIHAANIIEASAKALALFPNQINTSISTIWYNWPQKSVP